MPRIVRAGLIQASVGTEAPQELDHLKKYMIDKHVSMIEQAAGEGVEVLCLQELFYGPYFCAELLLLGSQGPGAAGFRGAVEHLKQF